MLRKSINYGIKTGYNKAFIIDNETKAVLITEDAKSAEILKPVLRGRDIKRYQSSSDCSVVSSKQVKHR